LRHAGKGILTEKDNQSFDRINADYELINTLSQEKVQMAKKLHNLLVKHANRLQVELGKITNPGEAPTRAIYPAVTATAIPYNANPGGAATTGTGSIQPDPLVYGGLSRTPITNVIQALKADANTNSPSAATPAPSAPVPMVVEPASHSVSAAPSPSSAPASKRQFVSFVIQSSH
jgi:Inhibitor of growth proteins N-terminal histone-binding